MNKIPFSVSSEDMFNRYGVSGSSSETPKLFKNREKREKASFFFELASSDDSNTGYFLFLFFSESFLGAIGIEDAIDAKFKVFKVSE